VTVGRVGGTAAHAGAAGAAGAATMPAAVYRGVMACTVEEVPVPAVGPDEVLVEVSHCGICGSDIHQFHAGWGRPGSIEGHEYSGRVVTVGAAVSEWAVGDEVVGGPSPRCGVCEYCTGGRPSLCAARETPGLSDEPWQGAFARYKKLPAAQLLRVPPGLSLRAAALAEPLAVALHAITRARPAPGDRVLVTGAGPIGALILCALRAKGIDDVTVSEPAAVRQDLARRLGAAAIVAPDALPTFPNPGEVRPDAFHVVFEASGVPAAQEQALAQVRRGGTLMLVGAGPGRPHWSASRILLNELWVSGSYVYDEGGFPEALALLASGAVPADVLTEPGDVPLNGLLEAVHELAAGRVAGKVLVVPEVR
jgi:(R,R)-butanediol dehydrogenase/meso-butanediol dehydrogenase/diacetyl reductase